MPVALYGILGAAMKALKALSPVIATVIIVAVAVAIAVAVVSYLFGILQPLTGGSIAGVNYACKLLPLKAVLYVEQNCAVGLLTVYVPKDQPCNPVEVEWIEIQGVAKVMPSPLLRGPARLEPGSMYYIIVFRDPFRNKPYFYPYTDEDFARRLAIRALNLGRCIHGVELGMNYPGSMFWMGRTTFFTWISMPPPS